MWKSRIGTKVRGQSIMFPKHVTFKFQTRQLLRNTKLETPLEGEIIPDSNDLDRFRPAPPSKKIDDKAAALEAEIAGLKTGFNRERFIYIFISSVLALMAIGPNLSGALLSILLVSIVVFLLGMGKYLDFPWIVLPLERWHDMLFNAADKRLNGNRAPGIEPPQNDNSQSPDA